MYTVWALLSVSMVDVLYCMGYLLSVSMVDVCQTGDRLISINGASTEGMTHLEAGAMLKNATGTITLHVSYSPVSLG